MEIQNSAYIKRRTSFVLRILSISFLGGMRSYNKPFQVYSIPLGGVAVKGKQKSPFVYVRF